MFEFLFGVMTGGVLFGGKKESDAEYRDRKDKAARQRAAQRLNKDLSHLPRIFDGTVTAVDATGQHGWVGQPKIVTAGGLVISLAKNVPVSVGEAIRVVGARVRLNGVWHNAMPRAAPWMRVAEVVAHIVSMAAAIGIPYFMWQIAKFLYTNNSGFLTEDAQRQLYFLFAYLAGCCISATFSQATFALSPVWNSADGKQSVTA